MAVKQLGLKSVSKMKGSRMSQKNIADRLQCCEKIHKMLGDGKKPLKLESIWFSDEKNLRR